MRNACSPAPVCRAGRGKRGGEEGKDEHRQAGLIAVLCRADSPEE